MQIAGLHIQSGPKPPVRRETGGCGLLKSGSFLPDDCAEQVRMLERPGPTQSTEPPSLRRLLPTRLITAVMAAVSGRSEMKMGVISMTTRAVAGGASRGKAWACPRRAVIRSTSRPGRVARPVLATTYARPHWLRSNGIGQKESGDGRDGQ